MLITNSGIFVIKWEIIILQSHEWVTVTYDISIFTDTGDFPVTNLKYVKI
jgi:hypothetical protein